MAQLNEVNLAAIASLVEKIQKEPQAAKTQWKSEVRWKGAFRSEAKSRDLPSQPSDEPKGVGGGDTGPNPVEQVLAALGNCLAIGYAANATVAGIEIKSLKIELDGSLDMHAFLGLGGDNAGFEGIRAKVDLQSNATPEQLKALHEKVVGSSPVGHTLSRAVPLKIDLA